MRLVLTLLLAGAAVIAQTPDPAGLPLLAENALQYVGAFRLPPTAANGTDFSFGGRVLAFNPARGSLFATSRWGSVAEVTIPVPVNSQDLNALPFATYLQPFVDATEGNLEKVGTVGVNIVGLLVSGSRLIGTASIYYDANNTQAVSHFARSVQLDQKSFSGWSQVWGAGRQGFVAGWMATVPGEWQARLGGSALTGQCCIPIVSRTSVGMAAFAFDPAKIGEPKVPASPLLYYTGDNATLGKWEGSNPVYGATTSVAGMAVIAGTRTIVYVGRNGTGPHCYGDGTSNKALATEHLCYDPFTSDKGSHAYPYNYQAWAYDLNDFAAVKAGKKKPWNLKPYAVWPLKLAIGADAPVELGGLAYDAERQLLYVSQTKADPNGHASLMHAFRVAIK